MRKSLGLSVLLAVMLLLSACQDESARVVVTPLNAEGQPMAAPAEPAKASPAVDEPAPAPAPVVKPKPKPKPAPKPVAEPKPICGNCGTVVAITRAEDAKKVTPAGAIIGGVIGGFLGQQVGRNVGKGNKTKNAGTVAGAVAGAYSGYQIEKDMKTHSYYRITVKMEDGRTHVSNVEKTGELQVGSKVYVSGDNLELR